MSVPVIIGLGLIAGGIWYHNQLRTEAEIKTGDQDLDSREPVQDAKETVFITNKLKNRDDYVLDYVGPAARGTTKFIYRDKIRGSKFTLYHPIEWYLA